MAPPPFGPWRRLAGAGGGGAFASSWVRDPPDRWFDLDCGITRLGYKFLWLIRNRRHRIVARVCGFVATKSLVQCGAAGGAVGAGVAFQVGGAAGGVGGAELVV